MLRTFSDDNALQEARRSGANLHFCADGALRGGGQAAAGICLLTYGQDGEVIILHRAGKVLGELSSAFVAEMLAMEWCLESFVILMSD
jgi:hypothetical protein